MKHSLNRSVVAAVMAGVAVGCGPAPEVEEAKTELVAAVEPAVSERQPVQQPATEPEVEKAEPEESAQARPPAQEQVSEAAHIWAPGKEGKLLLGLDGGDYEPYHPYTVKAVQQALREAGRYAGAVHGVLDKPTMEALGEFQNQNGLKVSGIPTPRTRKALLAVSAT